MSLPEERELAFRRLRAVCRSGLVSMLDFRSNPLNIFAAHDVCGFADGAMATKATVHFNLFAGTVLKLGTERHVRALQPAVDALDVTGCFALTELGYGEKKKKKQREREREGVFFLFRGATRTKSHSLSPNSQKKKKKSHTH